MPIKIVLLALLYAFPTGPLLFAADPSTDGLVLWLDASDRASLDLTPGNAVQLWRDCSAANNDAVPTIEKKSPMYVSNAVGGMPAIRFAGDTWFDIAQLSENQGDITLFVVFERPDEMASDTEWQRILSCWDGTSETDRIGHNFQFSIPDGKPLKPTIFTELLSNVHRGKVRIGANRVSGSNRLRGLIAEILVYDRGFLVDEQVQQVENYLRAKWSIPSNRDEEWTRKGNLVDVPARTSNSLPLSDQGNSAGWSKFEPLWDEFSSDTLDGQKWWDHNPNWFGRAPSRFLGEGQNVHVRDGMLELVMKRDDTLPRENLYGHGEPFHTYSSASVVSKNLVRYGYFEVCSRAMNSAGSSSFWFSSSVRERKTGKSYRSEIDVFEIGGKAVGHEAAYHMNAHIFETPREGKRHWNKGGTWTAPMRFADDFHVFALEWTPSELLYYVDGVVVRRMKNTHWHAPQRLIFDSETMGDWLGMPDHKDLPSTFRVEYVRAWKNPATDSDWRAEFEERDANSPTNVTRYVRSMDRHGISEQEISQ